MDDRTAALWNADQFAAIANDMLNQHITAVQIDMAANLPDPAMAMVSVKKTIAAYTESALSTILAAALVRLASTEKMTS